MTRAFAVARNLLPPGTIATGVGVLILGLASYVHLAIAAHTLPERQMADLSVIWALVFSIGYGLFLPIEQELTRVTAGRRVLGRGTRALWRRANLYILAVIALIAIVLLATGDLLSQRLFLGETALLAVTAAGLIGVAAVTPVRGQSAGVGRFELYGAALGIDGITRIILATLIAVVGVGSATTFGLILLVAPVLAAAVLWPRVRVTVPVGPSTTWDELGRGLIPLMISVGLSQLMLNAPVLSARVLAPERDDLAAGLLAALVLARVPTLLFGAVQASLLSGLAGAVAERDRHRFDHLLARTSLVVSALMLASALVLVAVGPWLVGVLFATPGVLSRADFLILSLGTWGYLLALVLGQGVMSLRRHRLQMIGWFVGIAVVAAVPVVPGDELARIVWAYAAGCLVVAATLGAVLVRRLGIELPRHDPDT